MNSVQQRTYPQDGIVLVYKEPGMSSAEVVRRMKRQFRWQKVGHAGTLDPFAEGLLVILVGKGTKRAESLLHGRKGYHGIASMGVETDTQDCQGKPQGEAVAVASQASLQAALSKFVGEIEQVPPMFSALKQNGQRLYQLARQGIVVDRPARKVSVYALDLLNVTESEWEFRLECSGGTYVRTLVSDWAQAAATKAYLRKLIRTRVGDFVVEQAKTLAQLSESADWGSSFIPVGKN